MISNLVEVARRLGLSVPVVPLVLAGLLTGLVFLAHAVARWFEDRRS